MESLFNMNVTNSPLGLRVNSAWPQLTEDARIEKIQTLLFQDLHDHQDGGADSSGKNIITANDSNINNNSRDLAIVMHQHEVGQQPSPYEGERVNNCTAPSRYESQKRRDWNTFGLYVKNNRLELSQCTGTQVLDFLRYLDQFGKTTVHLASCNFYGVPIPPQPCRCPLRQAWGSLDALIGRLRAAFEEHGGRPESNPFGARLVRLYLREVRESQAKARGVAYGRKKRKYTPASLTESAPANDSNVNSPPSTSSNEQQQQEQQQEEIQQERPPLPLRMPRDVPHDQPQTESSFNLKEFSSTPTPDPHPLNSYSPNSNPLIRPSATSFRTNPMSFYSFLDGLPGRTTATTAGGWPNLLDY